MAEQGSPRLKLFWSDVGPIVWSTVKEILKVAIVSGVALLTNPDVAASVSNHFGAVGAAVLVGVVTLVTGSRLVKDNSKG